MEEDLFNLFKHMNIRSGDPRTLVTRMLRGCQLSILKQLKGVIDAQISRLSESTGASGFEDLNPFTILGVSMDATEEQTRAAYRKKATEHHPDKGGTPEQMAKVNAAWEAIRRFRGWS